jgi:hypothetical protein
MLDPTFKQALEDFTSAYMTDQPNVEANEARTYARAEFFRIAEGTIPEAVATVNARIAQLQKRNN